MGKTWEDEIYRENAKIHRDFAGFRGPWERDAKLFDDFRYGSHHSRAEEASLLRLNQAPLAISITTAICDTAEALMTASKPVIKVAPIINPFDDKLADISKQVAQKYTYLIQKSWHDSLGGLQYDKVVRDYTNVGHGLFYIVPSNERGEFKVDIKHLSWKYFYPDPMCKDPFYQEADAHIIAMNVSRMYGYKFVKKYETDLTLDQFDEDFYKPSDRKVRELMGKYQPYQSAKIKTMPFIVRPTIEEEILYKVIPLNQESSMGAEYKTVQEITPELQKMIEEGKVKVVKEKRMSLVNYISIGAKGFKEVYPINMYNIVGMPYDHRNNPYPLGRVWYLYPLQRALNKFIMMAILNGTLMNSTRVLAEEGSIMDMDEWKTAGAIPNSILRYKLNIPAHSKPPEVIEARPLGEAFLTFPKYLTYIMEYISGIWGSMMGDSRDTPDTFSTVASLQSAGSQKIRRRLEQSDASLSVVGKVVGELYKNYAPINGFSQDIDQLGNIEDPVIYNETRLQERDGSTGLELIPESDLSRGFREVRFTTQGSSGYESATEAALLTTLATQLKQPELVPLILKRLNIADVDKVVGNMETINKQNATIEQMQKMTQDLEQKTKILANKVTEKSFEVSKAQFDAKLQKILDKAQLQADQVGSEPAT